jgi:hypothetical protein
MREHGFLLSANRPNAGLPKRLCVVAPFLFGLAMYALFHCFGKAFIKHAPKAVADLVPFGSAIYDIANDTWKLYYQQGNRQNLPRELQEVGQATAEQIQREATKVIEEVAADLPPEQRRQLTLFLEQIPRSIRQSFRRTSDPTGRTVPRGLRIDKPEDLISALPNRLPRFHEGQAVPGTDLVEQHY